MFKFVIVSCILAVCINFQKVEAAAFVQNPFGSLLNNAKDQLSNTVKDVVEQGSESLQNLERGAVKIGGINFDESLAAQVQKLKKTSEAFIKEVKGSNILACDGLYDKGRAALAELVSVFDSCLLNGTRLSNIDVKDLVNTISSLGNNLPEKARNVLQCFKNPLAMVPCLTATWQDLSELLPTIQQTTHAIFELVTFFPNVKICYQMTYLQLIQRYLPALLNDVGQCILSTVHRVM